MIVTAKQILEEKMQKEIMRQQEPRAKEDYAETTTTVALRRELRNQLNQLKAKEGKQRVAPYLASRYQQRSRTR
jgi:hypothetical protein